MRHCWSGGGFGIGLPRWFQSRERGQHLKIVTVYKGVPQKQIFSNPKIILSDVLSLLDQYAFLSRVAYLTNNIS